MRVLVLLLLAGLVVTCGQKGPLELPERNAGINPSVASPVASTSVAS